MFLAWGDDHLLGPAVRYHLPGVTRSLRELARRNGVTPSLRSLGKSLRSLIVPWPGVMITCLDLRCAGGGSASLPPPRPPPVGRCAASILGLSGYVPCMGLISENHQFHCNYAHFFWTHYPCPTDFLLFIAF